MPEAGQPGPEETSKTEVRSNPSGLLERLGVPRPLLLGYAGVLLFMIGDGVESNYLAGVLDADYGYSESGAGLVITVYGVFVAIGSYLAGTLSSFLGPRRVMWIGAAIWATFQLGFLLLALTSGNQLLILFFYGVRGLGLPLFAFGFLTWINLAVRREDRGGASGWFWFAYTGGLPVLGTAVAAVSIPIVGEIATFWLALVLVVVGALIALLGCREAHGDERLVDLEGGRSSVSGELRASISVLWRFPKIGLATAVRVINTGAQYGFFVALQFFYQDELGFTQTEYLLFNVVTFGANVIMNPISGTFSDRLGWRRSIQWLGGLGCTVTTLLVYLLPLWTESYPVALLAGALYGITLAGFVPLSALMPSMVPEAERGNAMAMYAFAAGFSTVTGPLVYTALFPVFGIAGVMVTFAGLYLVGGVASYLLRDESDPWEQRNGYVNKQPAAA